MARRFTMLCLAFICAFSLTAGAASASETDVQTAKPDGSKHRELPSFKKPKHLDAADIYDAPGDIKLLLGTLQGIVNREQPRIYLIESQEEGKLTWLKDIKVPYTLHQDYWEVFSAYRSEVKGMIVYDPQVPDSINVATTLAGLKNAVVASPELAAKLSKAPYKLKIVDDLRGKFNSRMEAYTWQYENLWKKTNHQMLIGLDPDTAIRIPSGMPESFVTIAEEKQQIRDASNRDTYSLDLSSLLGKSSVYLRFDDAFTQDGWGPAVHEVTVKADGKEIANFIAGTPEEEQFLYDRQNSKVAEGEGGHRFADNGNYFVYEFSPPVGTQNLTAEVDMWNQYKVSAGNIRPLSAEQREPYAYLRDYAVANKAMVFWLDSNVPEQKALFEKIMSDVKPGTPYLGWFSNDVEGEFSSVEIASRYGVYVLAADWFSNLTIFSGTKPKLTPVKKSPRPALENKIYVTYTFTEGDNFQYNQHRMRVMWDDPARGKVPINWTSSPLLYEGAPAILNYYVNTATPNDLLIAGPSGAGYFYPGAWPDSSFRQFLQQTEKYMKKTGMTIPYVLNRVDSENVPLTPFKAKAYAQDYNAPGLFISYEDNYGVEIVDDSLPVSTIRGISTVQDGLQVLNEAKANWDGKSPLFVSLGLLAWSTTPSDALAITEELGSEFKVVRADDYFSLIRESYHLPASK
ncbi:MULTISPECIES: GxGYxYP domain-containing protein [Paenibacillus]|uniref:GxGYxY motif-containing protein n=1 Tax=Paenibacillus pabuli TaxID=1472 RepID=A0A855Y8F0_9BACL|nr:MULTISPECIES: GxGYxYP domain-containing protein [Paenibacillus]PWW38621.1 GxGYxY motif-containing protein [Paenibacillus pabuli]PXW05806.1 GxGYxY motif-containing protein [Paenibacillus taichungensis]